MLGSYVDETLLQAMLLGILMINLLWFSWEYVIVGDGYLLCLKMLFTENWSKKHDDEVYTDMRRGGKEDKGKSCLGRRKYQEIYSFESRVTSVGVVAAVFMSEGGTGYSFPPLIFHDNYAVLDVIVVSSIQ